eukprot:scaffold15639_cov45-Isochrysis_galbana.AAC.1
MPTTAACSSSFVFPVVSPGQFTRCVWGRCEGVGYDRCGSSHQILHTTFTYRIPFTLDPLT